MKVNWIVRTAIGVSTVGALSTACMASENPSMFRADAARQGLYDSPAPSLATVKWRFQTKGKIFSSPVVHDGVVYVGSGDGRLYAVRASDGSEVWHFATQGAINSSPAIAGGAVFFSSRDGNVYGVNAADGSRLWAFKTGGERRFTAPGIHGIVPPTEMMPDPYDVFMSSPAVENGIVYIGSGDHNVYAIDAKTGGLRWKFTTGNVVHASPAVSGGLVYIGSWDRYFYALDARSGAVRWKFLTGNDTVIYNQIGIASSAAVSGESVYFGCRDSHFYALNARTGALRWKNDQHGSWVIGSPAISGNTVYYTTSDQRKFFAVDAATGSPRFTFGYGAYSFSSPSLAGGVAYFGTFDGRLYGIDATSGKLVGTFSTDASARDLPAHVDASGNLDLETFGRAEPTLDNTIVDLDRVYALGSLPGSPAIAGGTLFIGSTEGTLYAVG